MSDDDLPLFLAAAARERRSGIRPAPPPPAQQAPKRPKAPRRRRKPVAPPIASVAALPLARDVRLLSRLVWGAAEVRDPRARETWLESEYQHLRDGRLDLGITPAAVDADLVRLRAAVAFHLRRVLDRGPDEADEGGAA